MPLPPRCSASTSSCSKTGIFFFFALQALPFGPFNAFHLLHHPAPASPLETGAVCCGARHGWSPQTSPSLPTSFLPQENDFNITSPWDWYSREKPRACSIFQSSLHPTAFLPPGWSPRLTFLPSCLSIIPWFGWLWCSCCNFSERLRDWKGS